MQRKDIAPPIQLINKFKNEPQSLSLEDLKTLKAFTDDAVKKCTQALREGQSIWLELYAPRSQDRDTALKNLESYATNPELFQDPMQTILGGQMGALANNYISPASLAELEQSSPRSFLKNYDKCRKTLESYESFSQQIKTSIENRTPQTANPVPAGTVSQQGTFGGKIQTTPPVTAASVAVRNRCNIM